MKNILLLLSLILTFSCCDNCKTNETLLKEAEIYKKDAIIVADAWLTNFNKVGYKIFLNHQFPPPFDKIIEDSIKNGLQPNSTIDENVIDSLKRIDIQNWINSLEQKYGTIRERNFVGIHLIIKGKLFTYIPDKMKGFQKTNPRRLGLKDVKQLYIKKVEGTYAILMYKSKPTKTLRAEELIMLWLDENSKWTFLIYKIDDNI